MNEFLESRLNTAHALIDDNQYELAVVILKNLDMRIHDVSITTNINVAASDIEKQYTSTLISMSNKAGDPYEGFKQAEALKKWRAQQYLRLYETTLQKSD